MRLRIQISCFRTHPVGYSDRRQFVKRLVEDERGHSVFAVSVGGSSGLSMAAIYLQKESEQSPHVGQGARTRIARA